MLTWFSQLLFQIAYPQFCVNCGKFWTLLCLDCFEQLDFYSVPLPTAPDSSLKSLRCAVRYGPVAHALVHAAKFQSVRAAAQCIGKILYWYCSPPQVEYVVPVPLGKNRLGERGFNQAAEIAREYCALSGAVLLDCLVRTRETAAQTQQTSREDRLKNMTGSFALHPRFSAQMLSGKSILLLDDVVSTGATLESCASILLNANATIIYAQTFAHGQITNSRGIMELLHGDVLH